MNEEMMELLKSLMAKDEGSRQPYVEGDAIVLNSPYQNEILNQVMSNLSVPPQFHGEKGMRPEDALYFYNKDKEMAEKQIGRKYVGESKSIDDIINASNITQFLSAAMADKTNTDTPYNLRPDISKYSSDDPLDLLFKMKNTERKRRMTPNELLMILKEAQAPKPVIS